MKGKISRRLARFLERRDADISSSKGVVTFTFDDAYSAACNVGAGIIEDAGGHATYYVCGGLDQSRTGDGKYHSRGDLSRLQERGHEVACHGFGHLNYQETTSDEIRRDLDRNAEYFAESGIRKARNFAYPYGCVSPQVKAVCAPRFHSMRGVQASTNRSRVDLSLLKSVPLYSSTLEPADISGLIERERASGGWLIFFSHDVTDQPNDFDVKPELLRWAANETLRCELPLLSVQEALDHFGI